MHTHTRCHGATGAVAVFNTSLCECLLSFIHLSDRAVHMIKGTRQTAPRLIAPTSQQVAVPLPLFNLLLSLSLSLPPTLLLITPSACLSPSMTDYKQQSTVMTHSS